MTVVDLAQPATPLARHAHRLGPGLGKARGIEHQDAISLAELLGDLSGQLLAQGGILPRRPANEALQGQAVLSKAIRDRFDIFAFQIREQAIDVGVSMLVGFLAAEGPDKRRHERLQAWHHLVENLGGNLAFRQQLLLSSGVFALPSDAPSGNRFMDVEFTEDTHRKRLSTSQDKLDSRTRTPPVIFTVIRKELLLIP